MSSPTGFFDVLYLGVFIILSPAFDGRFYHTTRSPHILIKEVAYAVRHFHSLLHVFSQRFIILLQGEAILPSYMVDRMLGEFSAAAVVFSQAIHESHGKADDNGDEEGEIGSFAERLEGILQGSYPKVMPYYLRCLESGHKYFIWTGPEVQILPRSEVFSSIIPLTTANELLDLPGHRIYDLATSTMSSSIPLALAPPTAPLALSAPPSTPLASAAPPTIPLAATSSTSLPTSASVTIGEKRHSRGNSNSSDVADKQPKKRKR